MAVERELIKILKKETENCLPIFRVTNIEKTAYHEAGHVIMCKLFSIPYVDITIKANYEESFLGAVDTSKFETKESNFTYLFWTAKKKCYTIMSFAGIISGAIRCGKYNWNGALSDFKLIIDFEYIEGYDYVKQWKITHKLVKRHWNDIRKVAEALLQKETLTNIEVDKLLNKKNN